MVVTREVRAYKWAFTEVRGPKSKRRWLNLRPSPAWNVGRLAVICPPYLAFSRSELIVSLDTPQSRPLVLDGIDEGQN